MSKTVKARQAIEKRIAKAVIDSALEAGYMLQVNDGESDVLEPSSDAGKVLGAMFSTDEDYLFVSRNGKQIGWVRFIYGNDGWDVINDYTVNLDDIMQEADKISDSYQ